jgi:addiction module RelE/StbE family toxin
MNLAFSSDINKSYKKLSKKIQEKFDMRIRIFEANEFDVILNNHKLHGEFEGCRSINITGDIRAIYKLVSRDNYYFFDLGKHSELYE